MIVVDQMTQSRFKRCFVAEPRFENVIVELRPLGRGNERRSNVCSFAFAAYRCERAEVLSITSLDGTRSFDEALSYRNELRYRVGSVVAADGYDDRVSVVLTHGISYYTTREAAVEICVGKWHDACGARGHCDRRGHTLLRQ